MMLKVYCGRARSAEQRQSLKAPAGSGILMTSKVKRGRPATSRGAYNPHPARQFGRISDEDWQELKAACEAAGQSMVQWALPTLLRKARREAAQKAKAD